MSSFIVLRHVSWNILSAMFSLVCYGYLTLFEYILRIKIKKMGKWGRSQSFLERDKFYVEWNNYSYAVPAFGLNNSEHGHLLRSGKYEHKDVSESIDSDNRNFSDVKPQQIFQFFSTGIFYFRRALKRIRPIFQIFLCHLNIY